MNCPLLFNNREGRRILCWQDGVLHRIRIGSSGVIRISLHRIRIGSSRVIRISRRQVFDERKGEVVIVEKG